MAEKKETDTPNEQINLDPTKPLPFDARELVDMFDTEFQLTVYRRAGQNVVGALKEPTIPQVLGCKSCFNLGYISQVKT